MASFTRTCTFLSNARGTWSPEALSLHYAMSCAARRPLPGSREESPAAAARAGGSEGGLERIPEQLAMPERPRTPFALTEIQQRTSFGASATPRAADGEAAGNAALGMQPSNAEVWFEASACLSELVTAPYHCSARLPHTYIMCAAVTRHKWLAQPLPAPTMHTRGLNAPDSIRLWGAARL